MRRPTDGMVFHHPNGSDGDDNRWNSASFPSGQAVENPAMATNIQA
jgi:hypothetical protein